MEISWKLVWRTLVHLSPSKQDHHSSITNGNGTDENSSNYSKLKQYATNHLFFFFISFYLLSTFSQSTHSQLHACSMASCSCHSLIVDMNRTAPILQTSIPKSHPFDQLQRFKETNRRLHERRRFSVVVAAGAELSNPFSVNIGLDSQVC